MPASIVLGPAAADRRQSSVSFDGNDQHVPPRRATDSCCSDWDSPRRFPRPCFGDSLCGCRGCSGMPTTRFWLCFFVYPLFVSQEVTELPAGHSRSANLPVFRPSRVAYSLTLISGDPPRAPDWQITTARRWQVALVSLDGLRISGSGSRAALLWIESGRFLQPKVWRAHLASITWFLFFLALFVPDPGKIGIVEKRDTLTTIATWGGAGPCPCCRFR